MASRSLFRYGTTHSYGTTRIDKRKLTNLVKNDTICELASSNIRFGPGSTFEVGSDLVDLGASSILVFTDPNVSKLPCFSRLMDSLTKNGLNDVMVYDSVRVEPSDKSFINAIDFASSKDYDAVSYFLKKISMI